MRALLTFLLAFFVACSNPEIVAEESRTQALSGLTPLALPCSVSTDPTTIPALMGGGIWIPGEGVSTSGGVQTWASLATQANSFTDAHTGFPPEAEQTDNGAEVWRINVQSGPYTSWRIASPGSALQWTESGSYALWAQADALDSGYHFLWTQWPGSSSGQDHRFAFAKNNDPHRLFLNISHNSGGR